MRRWRLLSGLLMFVVLVCTPLARAETAREAFARGETLLAKGDFGGALAAYAGAARADRDNQEYLQHYSLLRRVVLLRRQLDAEKDSQRWAYLARALHSFYISHGLYGEALSLDQKMYAELRDASSAISLAETALAMNKNAEAAEVLGGLDASHSTPSTQALLGVALARMHRLDEARRVAAGLSLPESADPRTMYSVARLHAVTGNAAGALDVLARCFESVSPSMLAGYKTHAKRCPDFATLASTPQFADVLQTESKVPESKCSGGSKCAGCPMRGKCPRSQTQ